MPVEGEHEVLQVVGHRNECVDDENDSYVGNCEQLTDLLLNGIGCFFRGIRFPVPRQFSEREKHDTDTGHGKRKARYVGVVRSEPVDDFSGNDRSHEA